MKWISGLLALPLSLAFYIIDAQCAEIRTVGGIQVDLQPVLDWKTDHKGERPMAHWKDVEIISFERTSAFPQVVAKVDGQQKPILIRNCPTGLMKALIQKNSLEGQLANAKRNTAQAHSDAEYASNRASSGFSASGSSSFVKEAADDYQARRDDLANAKANLADATANEARIAKQLSEVETTIRAEGALLAMNTGQSYGNLEVWDTGMKAGL